MNETISNFKLAICILAEEDEDLEVWKMYKVLPDSKALEVECLRIIDESGEDYLYPQSKFVMLELADNVQQKLLKAVN
jgi:hypothetical protein